LNQLQCLRHNGLGRWQRCSLLNWALSAICTNSYDERAVVSGKKNACCVARYAAKNVRRFEELLFGRVFPSMEDISGLGSEYVDAMFNYDPDEAESDPYYDARISLAKDQQMDLEEIEFTSMKQTFYNSLIITINSYVEQALVAVIVCEVLDSEKSLHKWKEMCKAYKRLECPLENLDNFDELKKLRTLANVIKHGAGQSSAKLENLYPEFVYGNSASRSTKKGFAALTEPREIEAPMLNDEIAVSKDDVKSFLDSARKLLYELSSELGGCLMCNDSSSEST
ncbi:hypothetical protein, partial [Vibrio hyugaensis]|uniref:hypothetical protein n=1 Tax=Vibrio hyugaensis TaxID=1534743 RepID=UPI003D9FD7A4